MPLPTDDRYGRYVEYYGLVKAAFEAGDAAELARIALVTQHMDACDRKVSSVAIHDVAMHLPLRGQEHLVRLIDQPWDGDNGYFAQLLESLRAKTLARR